MCDADAVGREFVERFPLAAEWLIRTEHDPLATAVCERVNRGDSFGAGVQRWLLTPFMDWAPVPARYDFPPSILEWMAQAPAGWACNAACVKCGLRVPVLTHPNGPQPFEVCPACGGECNQSAANWGRPAFATWLQRHAPAGTPAELLTTIAARWNSNASENLSAWQLWPFSSWATPADDFVFPMALLEHMASAADVRLYHACGRCGLKVPAFGAMPICPACGGVTSSAAIWQAGPKCDPATPAAPAAD